MTYLRIAVKRLMHTPLFWALLAFLCFCVLFFGSIEKQITFPKSGIALRDEDPYAVQLLEKLKADGFLVYEDETQLCDAIRREEIAVGVAVKQGLTERIQNADLEGATVLYCTPTTSFVSTVSLRVSAHLGEIYAPFVTEQLVKTEGISLPAHEVRAYMDKYFTEHPQFEFAFSDMEGRSLDKAGYSQSLIYGMLAVLLFCLFALCSGTEKDAAFRRMHDRLGARRAFFAVLLPSYTVKYLSSLAVTGGAVLLCRWIYGTDVGGLWWRLAIYLLFLSGVGAALHAVLHRFSQVQLYVLVLSILSFAVCPVFVDLNAFVTIPEWIKWLLPPYFFYQIPHRPMLCAVLAAMMCIVGLMLLYQREKRIPPRTRI